MTTPVHIWDHVVLRAETVDDWLGRWRVEYLPAAQRRGMRLIRRWQSYATPGDVAIDLLWEVHDIANFYTMRTAAAHDPAVVEFWSGTDAVASSRFRRVLEPREENPCPAG